MTTAALAGALLGTATPARAEPPDGCTEKTTDLSPSGGQIPTGEEFHVFAGDGPYYQCHEPVGGGSCHDVDDEIESGECRPAGSGDGQCYQADESLQRDPGWDGRGEGYSTAESTMTDGLSFCPTGGWTVVECRDHFTFDWRGPFIPHDDTRGWGTSDTEGITFVPVDGTPEWWFAQVENESSDEEERGQGCTLARNPPTVPTCDTVRADRADLQEEIRGLERRQESERHGVNEGIDPAVLDERQADLDGMWRLGSLVPDWCWGTYPNSAYELSFDATETDILDPAHVQFRLAQLLFGFAKTLVTLVQWLLPLALTFDVTEYRHTVADFAGRLDQGLVHLGGHRLSLFDGAWFALFAFAGFQALRGRAGRAAAEIGVVVVLAAFGVVLIGNFFPARDGESFRSTVSPGQATYEEEGYFDSTGRLLNLSALSLVYLANGEDLDVAEEDLTTEAVQEMLASQNELLHAEFVERPYMYIQYGTDDFDASTGLDGADEDLTCTQVMLAVLAMDNADGGWVTRFLRSNGCDDEARFNGTMDIHRLMDVVLVVAVVVLVAVALGLAAVTLLLAKFLVAVFFVALPLAVVAAILPGRARSLAWGWATTLLQLWLTSLGMGVVTAAVLLGVDAVHRTTQDRPLAERWFLLLALMLGILLLRRRLAAGARAATRALQQRLTGLTGQREAWPGPAGQGAVHDVNLLAADRHLARASVTLRVGAMSGAAAAGQMAGTALRQVGWTVGSGPRMFLARWQRWDSARQSQRTQLANTLASKQVAQARNVLQRKAPTSTRIILRQEMADPHGFGHDQARRLDAGLAQWDYDRLQRRVATGAAATGPAPLTGYDLDAVHRLGLTEQQIQQWNRGDPAARRALLGVADRGRQQAAAAAGGWTPGTDPGWQGKAARAARVRRWADKGGSRASYTEREAERQRMPHRSWRPEQVDRWKSAVRRNNFTREGARRYLGGEEP